MNPNRLSRELRSLPGNIASDRFPGGSIVTAVLDRRLMTWSDRGGASRIFGEIWSEYCWHLLSGEAGTSPLANRDIHPVVLRLDDNPRIAVQAGRNKLPNPDFLVVRPAAGKITVQAVDAKFAVDRLRRTQISPESIRELVEIPGSLVQEAITRRLGAKSLERLEFEAGTFLGPNSLLNNYYYRRLTTGDKPSIPAGELRLIEVDADVLFQSTDEHALMQLLRSVDGLSTSPAATDVIVGMYYLRLAAAARWFVQQSRMPLLSLDEPDPAAPEEIYEATSARIVRGPSAYRLIERWARVVEEQIAEQERVRDAARLPVRMAEIKALLDTAGYGDDKKRLRMVRGSLERKFMRRLIEETGEIPASTREPIPSIVKRVRDTSRRLKPDMMRQAELLVERYGDENT